jgi:hypothetical protein
MCYLWATKDQNSTRGKFGSLDMLLWVIQFWVLEGSSTSCFGLLVLWVMGALGGFTSCFGPLDLIDHGSWSSGLWVVLIGIQLLVKKKPINEDITIWVTAIGHMGCNRHPKNHTAKHRELFIVVVVVVMLVVVIMKRWTQNTTVHDWKHEILLWGATLVKNWKIKINHSTSELSDSLLTLPMENLTVSLERSLFVESETPLVCGHPMRIDW